MIKYKILIIDDDSLNRASVDEYLSNFGFEIFQAANSSEGLQVIQELQPDLVLLDVNIPGSDGFETLKEIKRIPGISAIPVIFLTSYNRPNLKVKGLEMGAEDYITRPFDNAELLARIRVVLRRHPPCPPCRKEQNTLEGNLADMSIVELLQTIEIGNKTAEISLLDTQAQLILENGNLIYCRLANFRNREALQRILLLEQGNFIVRFNLIPRVDEKKNIRTTEVIMQSTAYLDEVNAMLLHFKPGEYIRISPGLKQITGTEQFPENSIAPLRHFIITLPGDLKENIQVLWNLVSTGQVELLQTW